MAETMSSYATLHLKKELLGAVFAASTEDTKKTALLQIVAAEARSIGFTSEHFEITAIKETEDGYSIDVVWPGGTLCTPSVVDISTPADITPDLSMMSIFDQEE